MKENLLFRATRTLSKKLLYIRFFSLLFMLPLLAMPLFYSAAALQKGIPQQTEQAIIYVDENVTVVGLEEVSNAHIVPIEDPNKKSTSKNFKITKSKKPFRSIKSSSQKHIQKLSGLKKPKFSYREKPSGQRLVVSNWSNTKNSLLTPVFVTENVYSQLFTVRHVRIFVYLMSNYAAVFSKAAALSQFLFSRPPPALI